MATMRAVQVPRPGGPFEMVKRPIPEPLAGSVRIKVRACGVCHSDALAKEGGWPGMQYPRVPGHEVAGAIDAVRPGVVGWEKGQPVGVGWHGGYCGRCDHCRRGDFFACVTGQVTGLTYDGGEAIGAVLGLGGLGHLVVQYAARMGFQTIGIARGRDKEPHARRLGAAGYIDSQAQDPATELQKLGGAAVILATATSGEAIGAVQGGAGGQRHALDRRGGSLDASLSRSASLRTPLDQGLVLGDVDRRATRSPSARAPACGR